MRKNLILSVLCVAFMAGCSPNKSAETTEEAAVTESAAVEWEVLFDGSSLDNWHVYNHPGEPISGKWKIVDSLLVFDPAGKSEWEVNDLVSNKAYENFELLLEWNISEAGNSGIFYSVKEDSSLKTPYLSSPEIQILDNAGHPDAKKGKNGNRKAGSLYDMIPSAAQAKPAGEWNAVKIVKKDGQMSVWQNDLLAVEFATGDAKWDSLVTDSKFKTWAHFGKNNKGLIGVQDHGNLVSFRNIKIREL